MSSGEDDQKSGVTTARPSLIGRDRELALLLGGLQGAMRGRGHCFVVTGDPGAGKTRLLQALADIAIERGAEVLWGRCWEGGDAPPLWPWVQIGRALAAPDAGATARTGRVRADPADAADAEAIASRVRAAAYARALVILIDDLHAASEPAIAFLERLTADLWTLRVQVVATVRDPSPRAAALRERLARLDRDCTIVGLKGLQPDAGAELVASIAGLRPAPRVAAALHGATGGNPFLLEETTRLLIADGRIGADQLRDGPLGVSLRIRGAIWSRIALLPQSTCAALEAVAVAGGTLEVEVLAAVLDTGLEAIARVLQPAVDLGLLRITRDGLVEFVAPLVQEAVLESVAAGSRLALRDRIVTVTEGRGTERTNAGLVNRFDHWGSYWTVGWRRSTCRVPDRVGLHYLATLLEQPHVGVPALDLVAAGRSAGAPPVPGETLERARARVSRAVRLAVANIAACDAELGEHLNRSLRTGQVCTYAPPEPVAWTVTRHG